MLLAVTASLVTRQTREQLSVLHAHRGLSRAILGSQTVPSARLVLIRTAQPVLCALIVLRVITPPRPAGKSNVPLVLQANTRAPAKHQCVYRVALAISRIKQMTSALRVRTAPFLQQFRVVAVRPVKLANTLTAATLLNALIARQDMLRAVVLLNAQVVCRAHIQAEVLPPVRPALIDSTHAPIRL